jgi:hypothetical protein
MIKKVVFFLTLVLCISSYGQKGNLENYQYIVVPNQFDFLKSIDKYQTSSLLKFLFEKKGFKVFLSSDKLPKDLEENRCLALFSEVKDDSSMFSTKNLIEIKDCFGKILYTSKVGVSKFKDYKKAYHQAIRNAFDAMNDFNFRYDSSKTGIQTNEGLTASEINNDTLVTAIKTMPMTTSMVDKENKLGTINSSFDTVLYAQAINKGFQLINTKPEVVFVILNTARGNVFILKDKNGILYKIDDQWVAEYYEGAKLIKQEFQIKF